MAGKIKVYETPSVEQRIGCAILGFFLLLAVTVFFFVVAFFLITEKWGVSDVDAIRYILGFIILVIILPLSWWSILRTMSRGRKSTATPILHVDEIPQGAKESVQTIERTQDVKEIMESLQNASPDPLVGIVRGAMIGLFKEMARNRYTLCEEGLVLYPMRVPTLFRWDHIQSLSADYDDKKFTFTVKGMAGKRSFSAPDNFEEARRVISNHTSVVIVEKAGNSKLKRIV